MSSVSSGLPSSNLLPDSRSPNFSLYHAVAAATLLTPMVISPVNRLMADIIHVETAWLLLGEGLCRIGLQEACFQPPLFFLGQKGRFQSFQIAAEQFFAAPGKRLLQLL